jgi:small conductance mechanosensitive channel
MEDFFSGNELIGRLVLTGIVLVASVVGYWVIRRIGRRVVSDMEKRGPEAGERASTLWIMLRRVALVLIVIMAVLVILQTWGIGLGPFLAVGTVVGAAVGFGAQDLIKDFIGGFFILVEDQFRVGDVVEIAGATGVVEDIQLRSTIMRDLEGNVYHVPNGQVIVSKNYTAVFAQPVIDVGVAYDTDVDFALDVMKDELSQLALDPGFSDKISGEIEVFGVNSLDESAITLRMRMTTAADDRWTVQREALRRIKKRFDAEGITIPFPQVTVHRPG